MNNESGEGTLLEKNAVLDAINLLRQETNSMRQEMNGRFDKIEIRLVNVEARLTTVEADIAEIKELQFSFDVRLERIEGVAHESLSIGHNLRADVKILRAEVGAWAKDVMRLETQMA
ncbi:MAG: hypothetical protein LH614_13775 [Pyrinomonadaceae bacterium]|nr:hypothetical protein [Pyrinomonadaceae bacterium]